MQTTYDDLRDALREKLEEAVPLATKLLDRDIFGYEQMKQSYAIQVFYDLHKLIDSI